MTVHNHGPHDGPGLACREGRRPDGTLIGACMGPAEDLRDAAFVARDLADAGAYDPRIRALLPAVARWLEYVADLAQDHPTLAVTNTGPVIKALLDTPGLPGACTPTREQIRAMRTEAGQADPSLLVALGCVLGMAAILLGAWIGTLR